MGVQTAPVDHAPDQYQSIAEPSLAKPQYNLAMGYLRAFVTVLVLAHHAVLAYHPFAPAAPSSLLTQPRWWQAFPVTDSQRWSGFALLVGFNDTFFMSLMSFFRVCSYGRVWSAEVLDVSSVIACSGWVCHLSDLPHWWLLSPTIRLFYKPGSEGGSVSGVNG